MQFERHTWTYGLCTTIEADPHKYGHNFSTIDDGSYSLATIRLVGQRSELSINKLVRNYLSNSPLNSSVLVLKRPSVAIFLLFSLCFCLSDLNSPEEGSIGGRTT